METTMWRHPGNPRGFRAVEQRGDPRVFSVGKPRSCPRGNSLDREKEADIEGPEAVMGGKDPRTRGHGLMRLTGAVGTRGEAGGHSWRPELGQAGPGDSLCSTTCFPFTCSRIRIYSSRSRAQGIGLPTSHGNPLRAHVHTCTEPVQNCQWQPQTAAM